MTNRRIAFHLGILLTLITIGVAMYWFFHGPLGVPHLIESLKDSDWRKRYQTIAQLKKIGPAAKPAVAELLMLAKQGAHRSAAAAALIEIDPGAASTIVPSYIEALKNSDARVRYEAAMVLAELGPAAKPAVAALVQAAKEENTLVRRWAVTALGRIGIPASQILPTLIAALEDPDTSVRQDALNAFNGGMPWSALKQAEPALRRLHDNPGLRVYVNPILSRLERSDAEANEVRTLYMLDSSHGSKTYTLHKLAKMGPAGAAATPGLIRALNEEHPLHRYLAAEALGAIGPAAAPAVPALTERLNDPDDLVRTAAAEALAAINLSQAPVSAKDPSGNNP